MQISYTNPQLYQRRMDAIYSELIRTECLKTAEIVLLEIATSGILNVNY